MKKILLFIALFGRLACHGQDIASVNKGLSFALSPSISSDAPYETIDEYNPACKCYTIWNRKPVPAKGLYCDTAYNYDDKAYAEISVFYNGARMVYASFPIDRNSRPDRQSFEFHYDPTIINQIKD